MANSDQNLADTRLILAVHQTFRAATTRMIDATAKLEPEALVPGLEQYWNFYSAIIDFHHNNEDDHDFPLLVRSYPDIQPLLDELTADHRQMVIALENIDAAVKDFAKSPDVAGRDRVNAAAIELRDLFFPHLDREDAEVIPMYAKWIPPKEWDRLESKTLRSIPRPQMPFAVGALDETIRSLPEADQPAGPPLPVKVMLALSWRKKWAALERPLLT